MILRAKYGPARFFAEPVGFKVKWAKPGNIGLSMGTQHVWYHL